MYNKHQQNLFVEDSVSPQYYCEDDQNKRDFITFDYYSDSSVQVDPIRKNKDEDEDEEPDTKKFTSRINQKQKIPISKKNIVKVFKEKKKKEQPIEQIQVQKEGVYMLPGESKNIPKNYTRTLKSFIINNFDSSVLQNPEIKKFLATKPEKACKQTLENSINNCQLLKQISQVFFGNYQWGIIFLDENKVELEPYFRFNKIWFRSKD